MSKSTWIAAACAWICLTASSLPAQTAAWRHEMKLVDYMGIYDFPEELVSFPFTCPINTVKKEHLRLECNGDKSLREYQLSNVVENGGYLTSATACFRSDLPRSSSRLFTLVYDPAYTAHFIPRVTLTNHTDGTAVIAANLQQLRVPADSRTAATNAAPILGVSRDGGATWVGGGSLLLPQDITLESLQGTTVEQGPLFIKYRLFYNFHSFVFNCNRTWQVDLTVQHNEKHVLVDELLHGFSPGEAAYWKLSYQKGLEPDGRLVMCNGGYNASSRGQYCGAYDRDLRANGALPYQLGLFTPNSYGVMRSTVFFNDKGSSALHFAINRPRDWKTPVRHVWSDIDAPENLYFFSREGDSYARLALVGRERHWALGLVPREDVVIGELPMSPSDQPGRKKAAPRHYAVHKNLDGFPAWNVQQFGAGPEVRLWQKLTDFSLNSYKDMVFDFDEPLTPYDPQGEKCSYDEFWLKGQLHGNLSGNMYHLIQRYWDVSGALQQGWEHFILYANSRAGWTADERRKVRSVLVFIANFAAEDSFSPQTSMMGGHPNFVVMAKPTLPLAATIFPKHPHAARWKSEFLRFWNEWLDVYTRRADPRLNTQGGRWMENVACYWIASLRHAASAADAMIHCDNTQIFAHPLFKDLIRWTLDGYAPCEGPFRRPVPIGAHAYNDSRQTEPIWEIIDLLTPSDPLLAQQLLWCVTDGKRGTRPDLRSRLYTDYGAVMHYAAGGPHEAFLTVQQLSGRGYRWTGDSNGALYYATKGHRWSWNGAEQNGDHFNIDLIPLFNLGGKSLGAHPVDGLLYDFDFAQYYKAAGSNPAYPWRAVMMLRDDCLAVYDHVADPKAAGRFQWCNYESHLQAEFFARPDFTEMKATLVPAERFPLKWDWGTGPALASMKSGPFSVRWTGMLIPETSGECTIVADLAGGDSARISLNNQVVFDSLKGKPLPMRLDGDRLAELKVEYIHHSGPARISVRWGTAKPTPIQHIDTVHRLPLPQLYAVKEGSGDQLHIVAPQAHRVETRPYGALIDGKQYVFCSATETRANDGPATFTGTAGYARENQVALFEGTRVGFGGLLLERLSGDFGISANREADGTLAGRIVGRSGGTIKLTPSAGFDASHCQVKIGGTVVPHTTENGAIGFAVEIAQSKGVKSYTISAKQ